MSKLSVKITHSPKIQLQTTGPNTVVSEAPPAPALLRHSPQEGPKGKYVVGRAIDNDLSPSSQTKDTLQ